MHQQTLIQQRSKTLEYQVGKKGAGFGDFLIKFGDFLIKFGDIPVEIAANTLVTASSLRVYV